MRLAKMRIPVALAVAAVLALAAAAWACTPQSTMTLLIDRAPGRTRDAATGQVPVARTPLEVRWNSNTGPVLGSGVSSSEGAYSIDFTVPDAAPGVNYVILTSGGDRLSAVPFQVTAAGELTPVAGGSDLWSGFSQSRAQLSEAQSPAETTEDGKLPAGIALLAVGAVAGGASAAVIARRRLARR